MAVPAHRNAVLDVEDRILPRRASPCERFMKCSCVGRAESEPSDLAVWTLGNLLAHELAALGIGGLALLADLVQWCALHVYDLSAI